MTDFSPREIVSELDRYIVGQGDAKRAVAIALRNRWRRLQLDEKLREEVLPKNILMIGPTGVGKTEISRRLARLAGAPFLKVEATKFTEVGYVGRDVEQIVRDLVEIGISLVRERKRKDVQARAEQSAEERVLNALVGPGASPATRESFRKKLRDGELNDKEIEIEVQAGGGGMPMFEIPGMPGAQMGAINIGDIFGKLGGGRTKTRRVTVEESHKILVNEESDKLLDDEQLVQESIKAVEQNGIVFLDEIDKIAGREGLRGADVSREGVQRDLLPLIEGTTVNTKHGPVKTDHILFIASGAFHISKPSDLLPELQGRLPIRVELKALTRDDFRRILTEPEASLIKQYIALMGTEGVTLEFSEDAIDAIADIAVAVNSSDREYRRPASSDGDGAGARRSLVRGARPFRRDGQDRRRLCAKAHRRSCQEHGLEPLYSVDLIAASVSQVAPVRRARARYKRTFAACAMCASSNPITSARNSGRPSHCGTCRFRTPRSPSAARAPFPVITKHQPRAARARGPQKPQQCRVRFALRQAVQIEPAIDFVFAASDPLFHAAAEFVMRQAVAAIFPPAKATRLAPILQRMLRGPRRHDRLRRIVHVGCR